MGKELQRVHSLCRVSVFCLCVTVSLFLAFLHFTDLLHHVRLLRRNPVRHVCHHELQGDHVHFVQNVVNAPARFRGQLTYYAEKAMRRFRMSLL